MLIGSIGIAIIAQRTRTSRHASESGVCNDPNPPAMPSVSSLRMALSLSTSARAVIDYLPPFIVKSWERDFSFGKRLRISTWPPKNNNQ
jgi:hypothetical protein